MPTKLIISIAVAATLTLGTAAAQTVGEEPSCDFNRCGTPLNVILIVADDVGVDLVNAYATHFADQGGQGPVLPPCTPELDNLAAAGIRFTNAWSSPRCSQTRAMIMTGMLPSKNGIGQVINNTPGLYGLDDEICTLGNLSEVADAFYGKWHIADQSQWPGHPRKLGFGDFLGTRIGTGGNYENWEGWNGQNCDDPTQTVYATERITDKAITFIQNHQAQNGWFLQVSYHIAHRPFHCPSEEYDQCLAAGCASPSDYCDTCVACDPCTELQKQINARAMMDVLDRYVGEIVGAVNMNQTLSENTVIIFVGDNGTDKQAVALPWDKNKAKGTLYQGGINVPLIIRPPAGVTVPADNRCNELVNVTDIFATVADFLGVCLGDLPAQNRAESISLRQWVDPKNAQDVDVVRDYVFTEKFGPNFRPADYNNPETQHIITANHERAIRNKKYKLIERFVVDAFGNGSYEPREMYSLYHPILPTLPNDPAELDDFEEEEHSAFELTNLYLSNEKEHVIARDDLTMELLTYGLPFGSGRELSVTANALKTSSKVVVGGPVPPIVGHQCSEDEIRVGYEEVTGGHYIHRTFLEFDVSSVLDAGSDLRWAFLDVGVDNGSLLAMTVEVLDAPVDVSSFDVNAYPDCDFLWSNVGESNYYQASGWLETPTEPDFCSPVTKTFSLGGALDDIMDAVTNNNGKFSVALKRVIEDQEGFTELSNVVTDYKLRAMVVGGLFAGAFSPAAEPEFSVALDQSFPNPANPSATVTYSIRERTHVTLRVYDVQGKLVRTLVDEVQDASDRHTIVWNGKTDAGRSVSSGVYFYRLTAGDFSQTRKMVLLK